MRARASVFGLFAVLWSAYAGNPTPSPSDSTVADAAERQDFSEVKRQLVRRADPNAAQADGASALHWAAFHGHPDSTRWLLRAGAKPDATNRFGITPLALACASPHGHVARLLVNAGADPAQTSPGGERPLAIAARSGNLEAVQILLSKGSDPNATDSKGQAALHWAASEGHASIIEALVRNGAHLKITLDSGFGPIHLAARDGRSEAVAALLRLGADVQATIEPRKQVSKGPRRGMSPLLLAVESGHFELALQLVEAGADPNDQRSGFSPLHALTWVRKPNRGDGEDGDPPPLGSGQVGSLKFIREIVRRGANPNLQLSSGRGGKAVLHRKGATPFLLACATADLPMAKLLVELGANPGIPNADGSTPLMAAAGLGTMAPTEEAGTGPEVLEMLKYLLALGADVNAQDRNGDTAMHGAAYKNLPLAVRLLADHGAKATSWHQTNRHGWTPVKIAEGYRVGNYKPSPDTVQALHQLLIAAGQHPPPPGPPAGMKLGEDYAPPPPPPRASRQDQVSKDAKP